MTYKCFFDRPETSALKQSHLDENDMLSQMLEAVC